MISTEFWKRIDNVLRQYDLLRHPFYRAWMQGKLTRNDLCEYSMEYYHHVESFPKYLREFARRLPAGELRQEVYQNLCDEEGISGRYNRSHVSMWMSFAEEMGADPVMVRRRAPLPKTQRLIATFFDFAQSGSEAEALATFYAYESQVPVIAAHKAAALRNNYGASESACEYFVLHSTEDVRHANVWREQLQRVIDEDPAAEIYAVVACELAAKALWHALDGIESLRTGVGG